ncbi:54S ribosomal protein L9 [Plectosphaerella cucumerina]|uniref:Large ribosomal subunit protein uL3m n=1 Tax=Plectosphaerella cucumerina TaxID=40658 RepID=A0A8K0TI29_9PEZI|nr:54S ribosomal protein L9 [Plectosphaerella cucumerina]
MAPRLQARCLQALRGPILTSATATPPTAARLLVPLIPSRGIRYGWSTLPHRSKPTRFNQVTSGLPKPTSGPAAALARREKLTPTRTGLLAIKKGMTSIFVGHRRVPATVLQLDQVQVVANKTRAQNGYWAVQLGLGQKEPRNVTRPQLGYYEAKGIYPKRHLAEFRVRNEEGLLPVGAQMFPDWFQKGQYVDVRSHSRGMGFAGGMKRHGFKGQGASHGNSKNHRTIGSAGPSQGSGSRVLPGKKMPGRMGNEQVTVQNLTVLAVDNELGTIIVSGPIGGPKGCLVKLQDSIKKKDPAKPYVAAKKAELLEQNADSAEKLQAARERHLQMKDERRFRSDAL